MKEIDAADDRAALPPVVTPKKWQGARDALLMPPEVRERFEEGCE
jgi:hypothetical protein